MRRFIVATVFPAVPERDWRSDRWGHAEIRLRRGCRADLTENHRPVHGLHRRVDHMGNRLRHELGWAGSEQRNVFPEACGDIGHPRRRRSSTRISRSTVVPRSV